MQGSNLRPADYETIAEVPRAQPESQIISPDRRLVENQVPRVGAGWKRGTPRVQAKGEPNEEELIARDLVMPPSIARLDRTPSLAVRGPGTSIQTFSIVGPFATLIRTNRPLVRWKALAGAESYDVSVFDESLRPVRTSGSITGTEWRIPDGLKAGIVYTWIVSATKGGREIIAPAPPARAEFRILEDSELTRLTKAIETTRSELARGISYANAGLLDDAEREFQTHLAAQPDDDRVMRLLQTIRSWRGQKP